MVETQNKSRTHSVRLERLEGRALFAGGPAFNGAGVPVAQVEADYFGPDQFEVNPTAVNQPASLFTYISDAGTANGTPPPNSAGIESGHADAVGNLFYGGNGAGVAPGVSHVDNYEVNHFINSVIAAPSPQNIRAKVINQSFAATDGSGQGIQDPAVDQAYDNYVARYNKIIVSAAGGPKPATPSTAYNSISVGASDSSIVTGPTVDGRSKPDISAPGGDTSYSAPQVAGAAALLVQAGQQGYGGWSSASDATDARTIKALLLNGATKPVGWTHTPTMPLDPRYGAGVVNFSNSLAQLEGGEQYDSASTTTALGGPHDPPSGRPAYEPSPTGWDLDKITSGTTTDAVNHYEFNVAPSSANATISLTATLTWERHLNQATINNLDLYLYNVDTHALVAQSISAVDNVEHLFTVNLPAGRYDLQVLKHGGVAGVTAGDVSNSENYALAFNFSGATVRSSSYGWISLFFRGSNGHDESERPESDWGGELLSDTHGQSSITSSPSATQETFREPSGIFLSPATATRAVGAAQQFAARALGEMLVGSPLS